MDFSETLSGFLEILRKSYKFFAKNNGKLIPSITLFFLLLSSVLLLSNILFTKPYFIDLIVRLSIIMVSPTSSDFATLVAPVKHDLLAFAGIEWAFMLATTATSLLLNTSAILSSAAAHNGAALNLTGLVSSVARTWTRPLETLFYAVLLDLGFVVFALAFFGPVFSLLGAWALAVVAILYFHLAVVWSLGVVVSVLEERRGVAALGKAAEIAHGARLKGFLVKLVFGLLYCLVAQLVRTFDATRPSGARDYCVALVIVNCVCFVKTLSLISFTVLYYECKRFHGEEISLGFEYTKTGNDTPLITADHIMP